MDPGEVGAQLEDHLSLLVGWALITALSTTDPAAAEYKLAVEREVRQLVETAIGDDNDIDAAGVARVLGHVWSSAISRWVGGVAPDGSVEAELRHAARLLTGS